MWNTYSKYTFWCSTNKDVKYYLEYVNQGDEIPNYDSEKQDGIINAGSTDIIASNIPDGEVDIYMFVTDSDNNYTYAKVTPNYYARPQKPVFQVGENVTASVNGDVLTLSGTGETYSEYVWRDTSRDLLDKDNIKHIVLENGITSVGQSLFYDFANVSTIQLPTSLRTINYWAFCDCRSLESIVIPEGVTRIDGDLFTGCRKLKSISLPSTLSSVPYLCEGNLPVENITLNKGIQIIGNRAFSGMNKLESIVIPDTVTTIREEAFSNCTSLKSIELPDSIETIERYAFWGCSALETIKLPSGLTSMGYSVFDGCISLSTLDFPASLKTIPSLGEEVGVGITSVTIPEGVENISEWAFGGCRNLTNIQLPSSIKSIGASSFSYTDITQFTWPENIHSIPANVFSNTKLTEFSVPETVTEINTSAFANCSDLAKITIPNSVTYFGNDVFRNCRNLTIYGYRDSAAERYANNNNIPFISADYKVIFKDNGRTQKTEYVVKGQNATPPNLTKDGYILSWDGDYTNIQEDMIINAVWTKKDSGNTNPPIIVYPPETTQYTVTFVDRGKTIKTEKVESGKAADYPFVYRYGYELSWDKDFSNVTSNIR